MFKKRRKKKSLQLKTQTVPFQTGNMLKLNNDKSEFFVATSSYFKWTMPVVAIHFGDDVINPSKDFRNLGIMFDDVMSMSTQVTTLSRSII